MSLTKSGKIRGQAGGIATSLKLREAAIDRYNKNPNICQWCSSPMLLKDKQKIRDVKIKKFCNHSCFAKDMHSKRIKKPRAPKIRIRATPKEVTEYIEQCTIQQLQDKGQTYQPIRSAITKYARKQMKNIEKICYQCGYDSHVEVCHIKAVASWPKTTPFSEINAKENLVYLCPNHHWEFDHGKLNLNLKNK